MNDSVSIADVPRSRIRFIFTSVLAGGVLGVILFYFNVQFPSPSAPATTRAAPTAPIYSAHSYHDGIMQVAPSVVSLYSSETIFRAPERSLQKDGSTLPSIAPQERRSTSQGSGVIISDNGIVLTNFHLIDGADEINVVLSDGSLHPAKLIGSDRETDLAVVQIPLIGLPAVSISTATQLRVGDIVLAIGNPFGVGQTVTQGIVSATRRRVAGASAWQNFVQIDAAINPGNSGGALINPEGQLVGINTAVFLRDNGAEGIGFAIPVELLAQVVPQMIEHGRVIRGWLGIGADDLPMFPAINRQVDRGAVITGVLPNSPANIAQLQAFDVVTRVGDQAINNATELLLLISSLAPGKNTPIEVIRNGALQILPVTLGERPLVGQLGGQ